MRRVIATKILTCIFAFITLVSAGGVFAAWLYLSGAHDANESAGVLLQEFEWAPEEVLPDDEEDKDNQTSHLVITNELLFNDKIGLIIKSTLNDNVGQKGVLHYVDHVTGGNLAHFQGIIYNSQGGQKLGFALEVIETEGSGNKKTATKFYAYTFVRVGQTEGEYIETYRTTYEENTDKSVDSNGDGRMDTWKTTVSVRGYAKATMDRDGLASGECTIDLGSWHVASSSEHTTA